MKSCIIDSLFRSGLLNNTAYEYITTLNKIGVDQQFMIASLADAKEASDLGVNSYEDLTKYFFIKQKSRSLFQSLGLEFDNPAEFLTFAYNKPIDYTIDSLGVVAIEWACQKTAYPNVGGKINRSEIYDVAKWVKTIKNIYLYENVYKVSRKEALKKITADWDLDEIRNFERWINFYEAGNTEKYNVKTSSPQIFKKAFLFSGLKETNSVPSSFINPSSAPVEQMAIDSKTRAAAFKTKMKSRLAALKRFVDKYNDLLPHQNLDNIYDEISKLEKHISKLNAYASMRNCVMRSANRLEKFGFERGGAILKEAVGDWTKSDSPGFVEGSPRMEDVKNVINRLESLSKILKSRDVIRELATIDIALNDMGIASHFPEITDSQSKLIESFSYSSNRIESVIAKLRGSGEAKSAPSKPSSPAAAPTIVAPTVPTISPDEAQSKPIAPAKKTLPPK